MSSLSAVHDNCAYHAVNIGKIALHAAFSRLAAPFLPREVAIYTATAIARWTTQREQKVNLA